MSIGKKILIIGVNGAGKTTFATELAEKVSLPLVHLDALYWRDNWDHATREEFDEALDIELQKPEWILDGNMKRTLERRLNFCDTVIYFDFPVMVGMWGAFCRLIKNLGKSRPDMGAYCPERLDRQAFRFIFGIRKFNKATRTEFYELLEKSDGVNIIIFKNRQQVKRFLDLL